MLSKQKFKVHLYGDEFLENQYFKTDDFENRYQEGGNLGAGGSHTPDPYTPSRFVLNKKIGELKARITETESFLEEKDNKLVDIGTLLEQKEDQINNLQKRRAGDKSGHARSVNKRPKFQENVKQIEEIPGEDCDRIDYISITQLLIGCGSIFLGKEIFGRKFWKKATGKHCVCVRLSSSAAAAEFIFDS